MDKKFLGLSKIALTICIGIPVIITIISFIRTGEMNIMAPFVMFLMMVGLANLIKYLISVIKKQKS